MEREPAVRFERARSHAPQRQRSLILDDDGDLVYDERTKKGPKAFSQLRLEPLLSTPVDSLAWCIMWGIAQGTDDSVRYWQTQLRGVSFQPSLPDPTTVVAEFCTDHGIEVFGSIRMNDCHDALGLPAGRLLYPLKREHPEYLIGDESQRGTVDDGLKAAMWSGLNYACAEVREDRFRWIEHTASAYDLDGVDLNFFRMPWIFKLGEEQDNMHLMTELMRRARRRLDEIGRQRGRPLMLGVRVPDTAKLCLRIGLDIETWLKEGLVDRLLTGGGYAAFSMPAEELVRLGHRYDVPVYPCINCPGTFDLGDENGFAALRGAASNLWWSGADGIYLWNYQYLRTPHIAYGQSHPEDHRHLSDIGSPDWLKLTDKIFAANHRSWEQYARATAPCPLPIVLDVGDSKRVASVPLRIGDGIRSAQEAGHRPEMTLRISVRNALPGDEFRVLFNGRLVTQSATVDPGSGRIEVDLPQQLTKQGENTVGMGVTSRGRAAEQAGASAGKSTVEALAVRVRYRRRG